MQIYSKNKILLLVLLVMPILLSAQIGRKKYITRSGDTTVIVMTGSTGLAGEDAHFLLDSRTTQEYLDRHSRYRILKDAIQETDQFASIVEVEKTMTNPSSGSLGFRIAQKNIRYLQNEKTAQGAARENIRRGASIDELTYLYEKFGGMPSYFINGVPVSQPMAASLSNNDILTRTLKVTNTTTENPNGEIWYVVNAKTYERLALDPNALIEQNYATSERPKTTTLPKQQDIGAKDENQYTSESVNRDKGFTPEQQKGLAEQQRQVYELQRQIEELRLQREARERTSTTPPGSYGTNKKPAQTTQREEIISFKDSPQEKSRRDRDNQSGIDEDTPKRSIRRIKDRQRAQ